MGDRGEKTLSQHMLNAKAKRPKTGAADDIATGAAGSDAATGDAADGGATRAAVADGEQKKRRLPSHK